VNIQQEFHLNDPHNFTKLSSV